MRNIEFINAGAGSGKTYKLVHLLADYLNGKYAKYRPAEVILTTFTDLAAAEFREKAREALLKSKMYEEASQLDSAAIGTIHAIAYSFVRQYWYLLGRGASDNVMSENDKLFFINQSLASLASDQDIIFFEDLLKEFNFSKLEDNKTVEDVDYWKDHLKSIIEKIEQYDIEDLDESINRSKALIDNIFNIESSFDDIAAKEVIKEYVKICGDKSRRAKAENLLKAKFFKYSDLLELAGLGPIGKELSQLPALDVIISAAASGIRSGNFGEKLKEYVDRVFGLAKNWKREFNEYKAKNRLIDYNDMERLFLKLLNYKEISEEIKNRYKLLLVDEFQDSSPIQVKIFDKLSELVERSIWVGDPKQAIYAFRGSDALLIKSLTDIFNAGDTQRNLKNGDPLNISYRSRNGLVQLSNDVFKRAFSDMKPEKIILGVNRKENEEFQNYDEKELKHWHFNILGRTASKADHFQNLSQQVTRLIQGNIQVLDKSTKELRSIKPEDLVILCKTNKEVNDIAGILQSYGLKTTGQNSQKSFLETAEVRLLLALLNYMQNGRNDLAKAEILHLCDTENYSVQSIIKSRLTYLPEKKDARARKEISERPDEIKNPVWENNNSLLEKIDEITSQIKAFPVPDLVESLIVRLDLKTRVSRWGNTDRRINNLEALMKHAIAYDQHCLQLGLGASLNNFIVYLTSLGAQEEKAEKVKGAVNVLTFHKAKGLEWNLVILESLDKDDLDQDDLIRRSFFGVNDVVTKLPSAENLYPERYIRLLPWFIGSKKKVPDDIRTLIIESSDFKNLEFKVGEETKRLMYVGVTRARDYLVTTSYHNATLTWLKNIGCNEIEPGKCISITLNVWSTTHESEFISFNNDPDFVGTSGEWNEKSLTKPLVLGEREPRYVNPSKVLEKLRTTVEVLEDFKQRIPISAEKNMEGESPSDAQIGDCLHDIFCVYVPDSEGNQEKVKRILKNRLMIHIFPDQQLIIGSIKNLYDYLKKQYPDLINIHKELPVQKFTNEEQIIRGSCDLVWETKDGYVLVDYKSFQGGVKQVITSDDEHYAGIYAPQLKTYSNVLESTGKKVVATLIYYAVIGIVVEVKLN
ncbi:MAG TPA: UvrD-helicase domain-containing protein [Bacteroidales bacterium]|nr:UvrD-helicase domain-containing protein [Bacteroidales bacterium]